MAQVEQFRPVFRSLRELFAAVKESAAREEPGDYLRDYVADSREFLYHLRLGKEKRHTVYLQNPIPDLPTLVVANHYVRPFHLRSRHMPLYLFGTTGESMIVTAIVTEELRSELSKREIAWLVKNDFSKISASLGDKYLQNAAVKCYGQIPASGRALKQIKSSLEDKNVGIYPEGTVGDKFVQWGFRGSRLGPHKRFFRAVLSELRKENTDFQILPTSIYYLEGQFHTIFGEVIEPRGKPKDLANRVMEKIADNLKRAKETEI